MIGWLLVFPAAALLWLFLIGLPGRDNMSSKDSERDERED